MTASNQGENNSAEKRRLTTKRTPYDRKISAIILAAGYSRRMGALKPILKLGGKTNLERSVRLFQDLGIEDVVVVVGHAANQTIPVVHGCRARAVMNKQFERGMFSSIQAGVEALRPDCEAFFLLPADIPLVRPQTIKDLIEAYRSEKGKLVFPVFLGRRGHPPLVPARYRHEILSYSGDGGLRAVFRNHENESAQIEVADEMTIFDLDTPADYEALLTRFPRYDVPTPRELNSLLRHKFHWQKDLLKHSLAVADLALRIAYALNRCGVGLQIELILAAAILHDIAKGKPNHALAGAEMISRMGFSAVAHIVAAHTDITVKDQDPLNEREVVYLADKLVQGCVVTSLQARFEEANQRYRHDPAAHRSMLNRFNKAKNIKQRCEEMLGSPLESILARPANESEEAEIQSLLAQAW
ncbi:MAG: DVU_1551 family NTP transferase [Desulfomonilaceae bacterium]